MEVWDRILEKGIRKVGMRWVVWRVRERCSWSKVLVSEDWTMKRMQRGRGGLDLEGP